MPALPTLCYTPPSVCVFMLSIHLHLCLDVLFRRFFLNPVRLTSIDISEAAVHVPVPSTTSASLHVSTLSAASTSLLTTVTNMHFLQYSSPLHPLSQVYHCCSHSANTSDPWTDMALCILFQGMYVPNNHPIAFYSDLDSYNIQESAMVLPNWQTQRNCWAILFVCARSTPSFLLFQTWCWITVQSFEPVDVCSDSKCCLWLTPARCVWRCCSWWCRKGHHWSSSPSVYQRRRYHKDHRVWLTWDSVANAKRLAAYQT
jgi:hypothetical protein